MYNISNSFYDKKIPEKYFSYYLILNKIDREILLNIMKKFD